MGRSKKFIGSYFALKIKKGKEENTSFNRYEITEVTEQSNAATKNKILFSSFLSFLGVLCG